TLHLYRRTRVVREHEHGVVVRRVVAPPPFPLVVAPWAPNRAEHVAPHHRGADAGIALGDEVVVDTHLAATVHPKHAPPGAGLEDPFVQTGPTDSERVVPPLVGSGAVPVQRHREVVHAYLRHLVLTLLAASAGAGGDEQVEDLADRPLMVHRPGQREVALGLVA